MKLWRKMAQEYNADAGKKHQGRKNKPDRFELPKHVLASDLLKAMFVRVGLPMGVVNN